MDAPDATLDISAAVRLATSPEAPARVLASRRLPRGTALRAPYLLATTKPELRPESFPPGIADERAFWRAARGCGERAGDSLWAIEVPEARAVRHSASRANVRSEVREGASVLTLLEDVDEGEELLRDHFGGKKSTASWAAVALELVPEGMWADPGARMELEDAVTKAVQAATASFGTRTPPTKPAKGVGTSEPPYVPDKPVVIYTDYPILARHSHSPDFDIVASPSDRALSALWLTTPFRQWSDLPPGLLVNQFPYEGCLVRKDLLPQTCRRIRSLRPAPAAAEDPFAAAFPEWFPPCYDLATESHLLAAHHAHLLSLGQHPAWIVKLAGGTRSSDPCIAADLPCVFRFALEGPGGDRVAQLYEQDPVLLAGRKFDLRVYVAVRRFHPLDAAAHMDCYARVAPSPYSRTDLADVGANFTVSTYRGGPPSGMVGAAGLRRGLEALGADRDAVLADVREALGELFAGAGREFIGHWPASRGLYGVDVLLAWREGADGARRAVPRVLEVNFSGDLESILERLPRALAAQEEQVPPQVFVDEALGYLFGEGEVPNGWAALAPP
ncbi:tubulin-tyrosine ligase family-domain-containing protein [Hyaloraphidium curvatum]|nr:tubulin-tyrosine ligase family-domain-containing protein [Hyaloraphidium curvatum]